MLWMGLVLLFLKKSLKWWLWGSGAVVLCFTYSSAVALEGGSSSSKVVGDEVRSRDVDRTMKFESRHSLDTWWLASLKRAGFKKWWCGVGFPTDAVEEFLLELKKEEHLRLQLMVPRMGKGWVEVYGKFRDLGVPVSTVSYSSTRRSLLPSGWLFSALVDGYRYDVWQEEGVSGELRYGVRRRAWEGTLGDFIAQWKGSGWRKATAPSKVSYSAPKESVYTYSRESSPKPEGVPSRLPKKVKWRGP